jgi:NAD(P)-dependent dehydrogenase (short-subunit alcohol dehydrogenase family)
MTEAPNTVALVTGANKGIGREAAAQLAAAGMTVLLAARRPDRGEAAAAELRATGADAHAVPLDVTDQSSIDAAAKFVESRYGRLDVLVNNAAIAGAVTGDPGPASRTTLDTVRAVFETNVFGVIAVTNAFLPLLLRSPAPRIVNVSSSVGSLAGMSHFDGPLAAMPSSVTYVPSKTALNAVTVQYAKEFRDTALRINAACPGYTATDLNNHTGYRTVAQGAAVIVRLATVPADGPTGAFLDDDGPIAW